MYLYGTLFFGQMNETPGSRMRIAFPVLSVAEYLRDVFLQDALCFTFYAVAMFGANVKLGDHLVQCSLYSNPFSNAPVL